MKHRPVQRILMGALALAMAACLVSIAQAQAVRVRYDRVQGRLESADPDKGDLSLRLRDGTLAAVHVSDAAWIHAVRPLDGKARQPELAEMEGLDQQKAVHKLCSLPRGSLLSAGGLVYSDRDELVAKEVVAYGRTPEDLVIEAPDWWSAQARELARFWVRAQGESPELVLDPARYRTRITKSGHKRPEGENLQETDTLSRLVYGLASTYILTGEGWALEAAARLVDHQRRTMRYQSPDGGQVYWAHAVKDGRRILPSLFKDDEGSIPLYEQIYALAGLTQYHRATGDAAVLADIKGTVAFMDAHFWDGGPADPLRQGYFSHVDPISFRPADVTPAHNRLKKNWNSIGDHLPAYLGNLHLGTGDQAHLDRLQQLAALIVAHFPDPDSPFVQERFHGDWKPDLKYEWQQNRAVIGHNLKIAWTLTSLYQITGEPSLLKTARDCADRMLVHGEDLRRGGWYDVIERKPDPRTGRYELTWHDRKAWWQQEQGILAYYVLYANTGHRGYLEAARAGSAFYNNNFPDHEDGEVFFDVQADGTPYLLGDRADKGSHSKSGYHSLELAYFAHLYTNLLVNRREVSLHFRPLRAEEGQVLRVQPIPLPPGAARLNSVTIDGRPHASFDAEAMAIRLPRSERPLKVVAVLAPAAGR